VSALETSLTLMVTLLAIENLDVPNALGPQPSQQGGKVKKSRKNEKRL
jgi:hypothetical protein